MAAPNSQDIITAVNLIRPIVRYYVEDAQGQDLTNDEKHAAVVEGTRLEYQALQASCKELQVVPWEFVEPLLVKVNEGLIAAAVNFFKAVGNKLWALTHKAPSSPAVAVAS